MTPSADQLDQKQDAAFFLCASIFIFCFAVAGFGRSLMIAIQQGVLSVPWRVHIHGAAMMGWLTLLTVQAGLIWRGQYRSHRYLGRLGVALFIIAYASLVILAVNNLMKDVPPHIDRALSNIFALQMKSIVLIPLVFCLAIWAARRDSFAHRRFLVLMSAMLVEASVVRMPWLPGVDGLNTAAYTVVGYGMIPILPVIGYDLLAYGRLHWATTMGLLIAVGGKVLSILAIHSPYWIPFTDGIETLLRPLWPSI